MSFFMRAAGVRSPDTTADGRQLIWVIGDSNAAGFSNQTTGPVPAAGVLIDFDSDGDQTFKAVDAAFVQSGAARTPQSAWLQFSIDRYASTGFKTAMCNTGRPNSCFNNATATLSWDTNGMLFPDALAKVNTALGQLGLLQPKAIFIVLGINDVLGLTIAQCTSLFDRVAQAFPGVDIVVAQMGDDGGRTNPRAKRYTLKKAVEAYPNVHFGCSLSGLLGAGWMSVAPVSPHPIQVGYNAMGSMFSRWMNNSIYSKWARTIMSCCYFDELSVGRKNLIEGWVTAMGPLYFLLDECVFFKTSNVNNIFNDWTLVQQPQNSGGAVWTLDDSIATNGATYFSLGAFTNDVYRSSSMQDCFNSIKVKSNAVPAGTLAYAFGAQFAGSQIVGVKQTVVNNITFSNFDANSGISYSGHASLQNDTEYTSARSSATELGYVNGGQVISQALTFSGPASTMVVGGLNSATTYPAATLVGGMTGSYEYFQCGKHTTMNHATRHAANKAFVDGWLATA